MYSPSAQIQNMTPEGWLRMIEKRFGKDYLTEEQRTLLLTQGITALHDSFEEEKI